MIRQHINKFKNTLHLWKRFLTWDRRQCIWVQTLGKLNELLFACLTCPVPTCFACLCTLVPACQRVLRVYMRLVPTCLAWLRAQVSTCSACLRAHVPTCLACLHANVPCVFFVPTCLRAHIFVIVLSFFWLWNKTVIHSYIALTRRKPLTGAMTDFAQ